MKANQAEHSISMMARVLKLSRSGYYAWDDRPESKRAHENRVLTQRIREIHVETRGIYGAPRIHAKLKNEGSKVSKKRVARLMRAAKLIGVTRRKKWKTTKRDEGQRLAPDLVDRQFKASGPHQLWVADITHIPTRTQPIYLATILDVWSRKVVGWSMSTTMPATLVIKALEMAMESDFAVIITDHKMPKMSSTDFCMELARRNIAASRIIVTAYSELDQMLKAINEARVFHYLTKPVHPDELRAKVKAAAQDHKTQTENKRLLAMVKSLI